MNDKILVLGGTGLAGSAAARSLQQTGFDVRIMARNLPKAHKMFDEAFEIVSGDAMKLEDIRRAMEGCYGVHISLSETSERTGVLNVTSAARDAGIRRITCISGATVDDARRWFPMVADKLWAETAIRETGIPYTIFCPTWLLEMAQNFIQGNRAVVLGQLPLAYHWLAVDDLGRMVASAYRNEMAQNKRFYLLGPEAMTIDELLQRLCARLYPQIPSVMHMPLWMARIIARVTRDSRLKFASQLMGYFAKIGIETSGDPTEANSILGTPCITIDQWLNDQAARQMQST